MDELAPFLEAAEPVISFVEEALDLARFVRSRSFDLDGAAHGDEGAHDVPVEVDGWLCAGRIPPGSNDPESSAGRDDDPGDWFDAEEAAPRSASIAAKKAISAAMSNTALAASARARAAAMREPRVDLPRSGAFSTPLGACTPSGVRSALEEPRSGGEAEVLMPTMETNQCESGLNAG